MTRKNRHKFDINARYLLALMSILLLFLYCFNIHKLNMINIIGDEFGYWAAGSFFAGLDWTDVASYNSYYSYGYSFWLALIIKFVNSPLLAYKIAIFLNGLFVLCTFLILMKISNKWIFLNKTTGILVSFSVMLFSGIFFSSQTTQCEAVFNLFFVVELYLIFSYFSKPKLYSICILGVNTIYLYSIHQRALVIVLALIITFVAYTSFVSKKWNHLFWGALIMLGALILSSKLKTNLLEDLYLGGKAVYSNNYSGQIGKIEMMLSFEGIKTFFVGILGKLFYLGTSTFGIFYLGIYVLIRKIVLGVISYKKKQLLNIDTFISLFLILTIIGAISIATIQLLDNKRIDTLIYGRYTEYLIPIVCIYGFNCLYCENKIRIWPFLLQLILGFTVWFQLLVGEYSQLYPNNIAAIGNLYYITWEKTSYIFYLVIGMLFFGGIICNLFKICSKDYIGKICIAVIASMWLYFGYTSTAAQLYSFTDNGKNLELLSVLEKLPSDVEISYSPYQATDSFAYLQADYLQFLAFDKKITVVDKCLNDISLSENALLITSITSPCEINDEYTVLCETEMFRMLCKKDGIIEKKYYEY